jgi:uncharacterized protein (TIGR03437 family)
MDEIFCFERDGLPACGEFCCLGTERRTHDYPPGGVVNAATSVEVNAQAIPPFFVSPKQINAQVPFGIPGHVQVRMYNVERQDAKHRNSGSGAAAWRFTNRREHSA